MAKSYEWQGDALARARYAQLMTAKSDPQEQTNDVTAAQTAGILANRVLDIEANPAIVRVNQIAGNIAVEQPAGTVVATFTPLVVPPFGQS